MDGVDLVVGVDFSKTNYHFLLVSNLVSKCWISPKATTPQKKPNAGPLPAIVRKKQPVGDMQEIVLLSIDDVHWHHSRILATKNIF